jgi:hypothetical protein
VAFGRQSATHTTLKSPTPDPALRFGVKHTTLHSLKNN